MRYARKDSNHNEIAKGLEAHGWSVWDTSMFGDDFPDIVVGADGYNIIIEIKDGHKPPSARKLRPGQRRFKDNWKGQTAVAYSLLEAIAIVKAVIMRHDR